MTEKEGKWNPSSRNLREKIRKKVTKILPKKAPKQQTTGEKRRGVIVKWLLSPIKRILEIYLPFKDPISKAIVFLFLVFPFTPLTALTAYLAYGNIGLLLFFLFHNLIYIFFRFFFPEEWSKD